MQIKSPLFGSAEIAEDKIIEFPMGLPGFEESRRWTLVHEEGREPDVFLLQSVDDAQLGFSITMPALLGVNLEFTLSDEEVAMLKLASPADAVVAVIVRKDDADPASTGLRANFVAPLVINVGERIGMQKVINRLGCEITLRAQG
jgi:flagellar assembly factor FliW